MKMYLPAFVPGDNVLFKFSEVTAVVAQIKACIFTEGEGYSYIIKGFAGQKKEEDLRHLPKGSPNLKFEI